MKKRICAILLILALLPALGVCALADGEPTVAGLYGFQSTSVTITPYTAANDTTAISADNGFYANAVRFDVTYTNGDIEAGEQCLLLVCSGSSGPPSADNIVYINQKAAEDGKVTFDELDRAYPSKLGKGDYRIYVVSEHSQFVQGTPTATFKYHVPYKLGDANNSSEVDISDAITILQYLVQKASLPGTQYQAADVNKSGNVDISDALCILQYLVGKYSIAN